MEKGNRIIDRDLFLEVFEEDVMDFARKELEENHDWFDGYPDRSEATIKEIIDAHYIEFVDLMAENMGWHLI